MINHHTPLVMTLFIALNGCENKMKDFEILDEDTVIYLCYPGLTNCLRRIIRNATGISGGHIKSNTPA